ncbi:hypothetical protein CCHR01_10764 [Colletotrichum chrysophilum]|uniref:DUF6546 domain-containing protein n=1 Tax=Colletotrichum chrysophilum TaxID=1836956 RepID=A0AAD9EJ26_9PEZI|nr:hypothetical protein CCHR01_10764 [Colletotrichum chrysophilum]
MSPTLPPDILLMIMEELEKQVSPTRKRLVGNWAAVSKHWHKFFEPILWHTLSIRPFVSRSNFDGFSENVSGHRRKLVHKILLHVDLNIYPHGDRSVAESGYTKFENNSKFSAALHALFHHLSTWVVEPPRPTITLELSASSPRDDLYHSPPRYHGRLRNLQPHGYSPYGAKIRLLGNLLNTDWLSFCDDPYFELPKVNVIAELFVTQRLYRSLSEKALSDILKGLPCLSHINYEPWLAIPLRFQTEREEANTNLFRNLGANVRAVTLWEAQSWELHGVICYSKMMWLWPPTNDKLAKQAARASFTLRHLAISHAIDATEFFIGFVEKASQTQSKPLLQHVALTCRIPYGNVDLTQIYDMLKVAAHAASYMGMLQILEIWSPGRGQGFFFRCEVAKYAIKITVAATFRISEIEEVLEAWQLALRWYTRRKIQYVLKTIDPRVLTEPESICKYLKLYKSLREW